MPDISILIVFALSIALAIFLPRWGGLALWQRWRQSAADEQREDALKLLFDAQSAGGAGGLRTLEGALRISEKQALALAAHLQSQGLVTMRGADLLLTPTGERLALQLARAHRLWERYLATEARMPLEKVHAEAHRREHGMTTQQVDELDAALGFPRHDPHGDPIPNSAGVLPEDGCGAPLTSWEPGRPGRVVHLEDEPPLALAQIVAEGIRLGQMLRILEASPERYLLTDGENEYRLAPAVAANVYLEPLPESAQARLAAVTLASLNDRQEAEIVALDDACQGFTRRRFLDLGLTPGAKIYPELQNSFGDPRAYRVRGTLIALRKDQAGQIWVRPV